MNTPTNKQPIAKPIRSNGDILSVHSCFWTLQGEGPHSGRAAVFLRLADCNLQCPFCDTEYTANAKMMPRAEVVALVEASKLPMFEGRKLLVITGGEPFRQNLGPLIDDMTDLGWHVQIETNGVLLPQDFDTIEAAVLRGELDIVISPKTARVNSDLASVAKAFKYVLSADSVNDSDGLPYFALGNKCSPHIARPPAGFKGTIYINPMDAKDADANFENLREASRSALRFGYTLGLQLHKYVGLE